MTFIASVLIAAAAACGDDDAEVGSENGQDEATTTEAEADEATTTEAEADEATTTEPAELVPVRMAAILSGGQGVFSTVMIENGIDQELGLEVEIVEGTQAGQQWLRLQEGSIDVAPGSMLDLLRQRQAGLEIVAVTGYQTWGNPILVAADSPAETLADMRGMQFGTPGPTLLDFMVIRAVGQEAYGIDVGVDTEVVPAAPNLLNELIRSGEIDGALQFSSLANEPLTDGSMRALLTVPELLEAGGFSKDSFYLTFNVREAWLEEYPDSLDDLVEAFRRTFDLLQSDDDAWTTVLSQVGIDDPESAEAQAFIEEQRAKIGPPFRPDLVDPTADLVAALVEIVGPDDVGITEFDADAFAFPEE